MKLNRFRLRIIIQSVIISFLGYFTVELFMNDHLWLTRITSLILWIYIIYNLIQYTSRTNERLQSFLSSISFLDTLNEKDEGDKSFQDLNISMNQIIDKVKESEREKEIQSIYFRNTVEHVSTGLIAYNSAGRVSMYNKSARELLDIPVLSDITRLDELKTGLSGQVQKTGPGESFLSAVVIRGQLHRIIFRKAIIKIREEEISVLSLQDIRSQLEEEELETWQKLISILRHEIMNSVAPLNSLSNSLTKIVKKIREQIPAAEADMLRDGLDAIARRSDGLMDFVKAYKTLTSVPTPKFEEFSARSLLEDCMVLFKREAQDRNISIELHVENDPLIIADYGLLSQVIINLIKNALEAMETEGGSCILKAEKKTSGEINIKVEDTGKGIPDAHKEKIFLPFFTTRESGSGIGLSLARQIMRLHKGNIDVSSEEGKGTKFTLIF